MALCTSFWKRIVALLTFGKNRGNEEMVYQRAASIPLSTQHTQSFDIQCAVLERLAKHPAQFIRAIYRGSKSGIFIRLYHLEACVDSESFLDTLVSVTRDQIDSVVPYEYQNVRAYFYYLIHKARILEHKATHPFPELTDPNHYAFNLDKIVAEVKENTRLATRLTVFFSYYHAGDNLELGHSILRKRLALFECLFEQNICLIMFLMSHTDRMEGREPGRELLGLMSGFKTLAEKYSTEFKDLKLGLNFEDRVKTLTAEMVHPLIILAQKIIFLKQHSVEKVISDLRSLQKSIAKFRQLREQHTPFLDTLNALIEQRIQLRCRPPPAAIHKAIHKAGEVRRPSRLSLLRTVPNFLEDQLPTLKLMKEKGLKAMSARKITMLHHLERDQTDAPSVERDREHTDFDFDTIFKSEERPRVHSTYKRL